MSTLQIKLTSSSGDWESVQFPLQIIDEQLRQLNDIPNSIQVDRSQVIEIPPGRYLIRVHTSGLGIVSGQVTVEDREGPQDVNLQIDKQPSRQEDDKYSSFKKQGRSFRKRKYLVSPKDSVRNYDRLHKEISVISLKNPENLHLESSLNSVHWISDPPTMDFLGPGIHLERDGISYSFGLRPPGQYALVNKANWSKNSGGQRIWKLFLIPPFPHGRAAFVRAAPVRERDSDLAKVDFDSFEIDFYGADPQISSLLAFFSQGNFEAVNQFSDYLVSRAENYMRGKFNNPMNAVIGGYLLIKAGRLDKLHDWTINLKNGFPTIPDGAVIHAWFLLLRKHDGFNDALASLLQAADRGIPYLSTGVRLLFDGLMFFRNHDDVEQIQKDNIQTRITKISPWVSCIDWTKPYTVLEVSNFFD